MSYTDYKSVVGANAEDLSTQMTTTARLRYKL